MDAGKAEEGAVVEPGEPDAGSRKRGRQEAPLHSFGDVRVDLTLFKDDALDTAFAPEAAGDPWVGGLGGAGEAAEAGTRVRGPSHNHRMHPRNEYRDRRPDFAKLAATVPSFAPLCVLR